MKSIRETTFRLLEGLPARFESLRALRFNVLSIGDRLPDKSIFVGRSEVGLPLCVPLGGRLLTPATKDRYATVWDNMPPGWRSKETREFLVRLLLKNSGRPEETSAAHKFSAGNEGCEPGGFS